MPKAGKRDTQAVILHVILERLCKQETCPTSPPPQGTPPMHGDYGVDSTYEVRSGHGSVAFVTVTFVHLE